MIRRYYCLNQRPEKYVNERRTLDLTQTKNEVNTENGYNRCCRFSGTMYALCMLFAYQTKVFWSNAKQGHVGELMRINIDPKSLSIPGLQLAKEISLK